MSRVICIRQILLVRKLPPGISGPILELIKLEDGSSVDAPKVFTDIRNALVHSRQDAVSQLLEYTTQEKR